MDFVSDNPVPIFTGEQFFKYFAVETVDMAAPGFETSKEATLRGIAASVILQNSKSADKLDAFIPYLAMTYLDRFISKNQLPDVLGCVRDNIVLAANSCLTIAWKMRDKSFSFLKFLEKNNLDRYYQKHILEMELKILKGLEWRTRAVMPMCFVPYFLEKSSVRGIRRRAVNEIIIESQDDIRYTRFKPSVIAAAAVIVACRLEGVGDGNVKMLPHNRCRLSLLETGYVNPKKVDWCSEMMMEMCMKKKMLLKLFDNFFEDVVLKKAHVPGGEASSSSSHTRRHGKEPVHEISEIQVDEPELIKPDPKAEPEGGMDFELKWQLDTNELARQLSNFDFDSPFYRSPLHAAYAEAEAKKKPITVDEGKAEAKHKSTSTGKGKGKHKPGAKYKATILKIN